MKEGRKSEEKNYLGDTYSTLNSGHTTLSHTFLFDPHNFPFLDKRISLPNNPKVKIQRDSIKAKAICQTHFQSILYSYSPHLKLLHLI